MCNEGGGEGGKYSSVAETQAVELPGLESCLKKALKDLLSISSLLQLFLCSPIVCCHMSGRLCEDCSPTYAFSRRQGVLHGPVKLYVHYLGILKHRCDTLRFSR